VNRDLLLDLLGLNPRTRAAERMAADAEEMRALLELENRRRRAAGLDEVTEQELRDSLRP
jgi:hypothetical protein